MQAKGKKKSASPEMIIVFDTSFLYTKSEHYFFKKEVSELISANNGHKDIDIKWYVPEVVKHERQYQMTQKAIELLPAIQRLEKLLGHNLNITEDIVITRVKEAINKQFDVLKIHTGNLDVEKVEWEKIIFNSVFRQPPFEAGDKEKGFRDSLVAEAFLQLVAKSPKTAKSCRLVLLTEDKLMTEAVSEKIKGATNVRVLPSIEELKGLINTLVSEADETFINSIQEKCKQYFFQKENKETLYYKEEVRKLINDSFGEQLKEKPKGCETRDNGTWYIGGPQFIKKEGQRIFWATRITVEAKAYNNLKEQTQELGKEPVRRLSELGLGMAPPSQRRGLLSLLGASEQEKILVTEGSTIFEVDWSISVTTTTKSLSKQKIENIKFVETVWDQDK